MSPDAQQGALQEFQRNAKLRQLQSNSVAKKSREAALKKGLIVAANRGDTETYNRYRLELGTLRGGPSIIEMTDIPPLAVSNIGSDSNQIAGQFRGFVNPFPHSQAGTFDRYSGKTTWTGADGSVNSISDAEQYDRLMKAETDATGFGGPNGYVVNPFLRKDRVKGWLRDNVSRTGANSMAFMPKVKEMRDNGYSDDEILTYIQDPKNFKDLSEQSLAAGLALSILPGTRQVFDVMGLADMADQAMTAYGQKTGEGMSSLEAIGSTAKDFATGFIAPITEIGTKLADKDMSLLGKASAIGNAALIPAALLHGGVRAVKGTARTKVGFNLLDKAGLTKLAGKETRIMHGFDMGAGDVADIAGAAKKALGRKGKNAVLDQLARAGDARRKIADDLKPGDRALKTGVIEYDGLTYDQIRAKDAGTDLKYDTDVKIGEETMAGKFNKDTGEITIDKSNKNKTVHSTHEIIHSIEEKSGFNEGRLRELLGEDGFASLQENVAKSISDSLAKDTPNRAVKLAKGAVAEAADYYSKPDEISRFYLDKYLYDPKSMLKSKNKFERQLAQSMRDKKVDRFAHLLIEDGVLNKGYNSRLGNFTGVRKSKAYVSMDLVPNAEVNPKGALAKDVDVANYTDFAADKTVEELRKMGYPIERVIKNEGWFEGQSSPGHQFEVNVWKDKDGNLTKESRQIMDEVSSIIGRAHDQKGMAWNDFDLPVPDHGEVAVHLDNYTGDARGLERSALKAFKKAGLDVDEVVVIPTGEDAIAFPLNYSGKGFAKADMEVATANLKKSLNGKGVKTNLRLSGRSGDYFAWKPDDFGTKVYEDGIKLERLPRVHTIKDKGRSGYAPGYKPTIARKGRLDGKLSKFDLPDDPTSTDTGGGNGQVGSKVFDNGDETIDLIHYSKVGGLKELDPAFMGTGIFPNDTDKRTAANPNSIKEINYYPPKTRQEWQVFSGAKAAYKAVMKKSELYSLHEDPLDIAKRYGGAYKLADGTLTNEWSAGEREWVMGHRNYETLKKEIRDAGYRGFLMDGGNRKGDPYVRVFDKIPVDEIPIEEARSREQGSRDFGNDDDAFYSTLIRTLETKLGGVIRDIPDTIVPGKVIPEKRIPMKDGSVKIIPEQVTPDKVNPGVTKKEQIMRLVNSTPGITENEIRYFMLEEVLDDLAARGDFTKEDLATMLKANKPDLVEYEFRDGDEKPDFYNKAQEIVDDAFDPDEYIANRYSDEIDDVNKSFLANVVDKPAFDQKTFYAGILRDFIEVAERETVKKAGGNRYWSLRGEMPGTLEEIIASVDHVADSATLDDFRNQFLSLSIEHPELSEKFRSALTEIFYTVNSADPSHVANKGSQPRLPELGDFSELSLTELFDLLVSNPEKLVPEKGSLYRDDIIQATELLNSVSSSHWINRDDLLNYLYAKEDPRQDWSDSWRDEEINTEERRLRERWEPENEGGEDGPTEYKDYSDQRLEDYTELTVHLNSHYIGKDSIINENYNAPHFDNAGQNLIVHGRFGFDPKDGSLVIDEIQSDIHQAAEKQGYQQMSISDYDDMAEVKAVESLVVKSSLEAVERDIFNESVKRSSDNFAGLRGWMTSHLGANAFVPGTYIYEWMKAGVAEKLFVGEKSAIEAYKDSYNRTWIGTALDRMITNSKGYGNLLSKASEPGGDLIEKLPELAKLDSIRSTFESMLESNAKTMNFYEAEPVAVLRDIEKERKVTQEHVDRLNLATEMVGKEPFTPSQIQDLIEFVETSASVYEKVQQMVLDPEKYGLKTDAESMDAYRGIARRAVSLHNAVEDTSAGHLHRFSKPPRDVEGAKMTIEKLTETVDQMSRASAAVNPEFYEEIKIFKGLVDYAISGQLGRFIRNNTYNNPGKITNVLETLRKEFGDSRLDSLIEMVKPLEAMVKQTEGVPPAPFDSTQQWAGLMVRRLLAEAAKSSNGRSDVPVQVTPGWTQVSRYFGYDSGNEAFNRTVVNTGEYEVDYPARLKRSKEQGKFVLESGRADVTVEVERDGETIKYLVTDNVQNSAGVAAIPVVYRDAKSVAESLLSRASGYQIGYMPDTYDHGIKALAKAIAEGAEWDGTATLKGYHGKGSGHLEFYNSILPKILQKYLKSLDPNTPDPVPAGEYDGRHKFTLTKEAAKSILDNGQPLFKGSKEFGGGAPEPEKLGMLARIIKKLTGESSKATVKAYRKNDPKTPLPKTDNPQEPTPVEPPAPKTKESVVPDMEREDTPRTIPPDKVDEPDLGQRSRMRDRIKNTEDYTFEYKGKSYRSQEEAQRIGHLLRDRVDITKLLASRELDKGYGTTDFEIAAISAELADAEALYLKVSEELSLAEATGDEQAIKMAQETLQKVNGRIADLTIGGIEGNSNNGRNLAAARMFARGAATSSPEAALKWVQATNRGAKTPRKTQARIVEKAMNVQKEAKAMKIEEAKKVEKAKSTLASTADKLKGKKITLKDLEGC